MLVTPPMNIKGRFVLKSPFVAQPTKMYKVIGLRQFKELVANSVDVLGKFYTPIGLTKDDYDRDYKEGATLVILFADDGEMISVPDSYVQSFPSQSLPLYGNYVVSAQVGAFRSDYDFSFTKQRVSEILSDTLGVEVTVNVDAIGEGEVISVNDAETLETNRQAAIKDRQTSYAKLLAANATIETLQETIKVLQEIAANKK